MKIAVLDSNGVQSTRQGKIQHYYVVANNYNFAGNLATEVTDIKNLKLMYSVFRMGYIDFRDSLISYEQTITFETLPIKGKKTLAKNFAVNKTKRDTVFSTQLQEDFAKDVQHYIDISSRQVSFENNASIIAADSGVPNLSGLTTNIFLGSYVDEVSSESETSTNANTFQQKLNLSTDSIPAGKYKISWSMEAKGTATNDMDVRVRSGGVDLMLNNIEFKDATNWVSIGGFKYVTLAQGTHNINVGFKSESNNTVSLRSVRLDIWRIS